MKTRLTCSDCASSEASDMYCKGGVMKDLENLTNPCHT